jgi:hypothetical protein
MASNLNPQASRFFAKIKGAKKSQTCCAVYAGVIRKQYIMHIR